MTTSAIRGLRLIETLGGSIFGVGLMLNSITNWQDWRAYAVQIMGLILICMTEIWLQDDEFKEQKEQEMNQPEEPKPIPTTRIRMPSPGEPGNEGRKLPLPTPTPPPTLPITDGERDTMNELQQRINGPIWWSEFEAGHSYRLFNAPWEEHHGYQVLKAPTQRLAGEKFQAYTPTPVEDNYIVSALNAVPRYEERLRELEQQHLDLIHRAWRCAKHEEYCPAMFMSSSLQMMERCNCSVLDILPMDIRARAREE